MPDLQKAFLKKLFLKNFKKFSNCEVEFSPGLNILVGPNNAGKTTLLEAIDILIGERNLSSLAVKRNFFNSFKSGEANSAKLVLEIVYPDNSGNGANEVNIIKQLKIGRGSTSSKLANLQFSNHITAYDILNSSLPTSPQFNSNTTKSGYTIDGILLVTEISVLENYSPDVAYDLYINFWDVDHNPGCYKIIGVSGGQRATLFNYLLLPANRINNKSLTEITDFNWLGRYLKGHINKEKINEKLSDFKDNSEYPPEVLEPGAGVIFSKLFSKEEKLTLNLFNKDDLESIVTNARFYISDGYNDEIINKAQGIQSAAIISLFAGYCQFQSEWMPKNPKVHSMWNTIFSFEEPESHFQFPLRNKLLRILKEEFLDEGAQVLISTHDGCFVSWQYIHMGRIIFPNSISENQITTINLADISDQNLKRMIRFSANCFFTDIVLIVEGQEEICIDLLVQLISSQSIEESGVVITRSVGGVRSNAPETSDKNQLGGKDDIPGNINFFNNLGIEALCLIDVDALFNEGSCIKQIYNERTGQDLVLSKKYESTDPAHYLKLKKWWLNNKSDDSLLKDITTLSDAGIFLFPGDFESLFTDEYLEKYQNPGKPNQLNKEKFTYETKFLIETHYEEFLGYLSEDGKIFLKAFPKQVEIYTEKIRKTKKETFLGNLDGGTIGEILEKDDDLPF